MPLSETKDSSQDSHHDPGIASFFRSLGEKPATTVSFFDRGEFYSLFGQDALLAAKEFFRSNSSLKYITSGDVRLEYMWLSKSNFEAFVRDLLLVRHYRVEVYKQQNTSKSDWQIEYKASPGNLVQFEDVLFGNHSELTTNTGLLSLKFSSESGQKVVGVAYVDVSGHVMQVGQFHDGDSFSNLEALVVQLGPKECILPAGDLGPDGTKIKEVLSRNNLLITERKRTEFTPRDTQQDLKRLLRGRNEEVSAVGGRLEFDMTNGMVALAAAIKYLDLLADEGNFKQFALTTYELSQFMRLDTAVMKALHIDPSTLSQNEAHLAAGKNTTLLCLLDKCRTPQGHRLLAQWLRQPLTDINKITERQDLVEALVSFTEVRHILGEDHLKRIPDLHRLARKLAKKAATLQDCYRLYQCFDRIPHLCEAIASYSGHHERILAAAFTTPIQELLGDLAKFQEMIETTVDLEQASQGNFVIKPDFDEELAELRERMNDFEFDIEKEQKVVAHDLHLEAGKTLKLESNSQYGYFFRITLKEEKTLRNNSSYMMLDTNKAGVRFRSAVLSDLNDQHKSAKEQYLAQQKSVVDEIISIAAGYVGVIQSLGNVLASLDCIYALASAAVSGPRPYIRPKILNKDQSRIQLKACRHPCLEQQEDTSFIPNDCTMDKENGKFHIITGPNMGGKSTFLRSVGLTVLMAQVGSFVPCDQAEVSIVDSILARVGAGDCQLKGVSTFMAEMLETATILKKATKSSLIIIDELGRGTSTYDGFGLAWAISEAIAKDIGAYCLFATHFHELTTLSEECYAVRNYHVAATTAHGNLTLLYQVKKGPCDRSFGIHVAGLAHFPVDVIEYAKRKADELEDDFHDEDETEEISKRKKEVKKEGEKEIEELLGRLDVVKRDIGDQQEKEEKVEEIISQIRKSENAYIRHLVKKAYSVA